MSVKQGDVVLAWFPFASGKGGKRRPGLIVQNDADDQKLAKASGRTKVVITLRVMSLHHAERDGYFG